MRKPRGRHPAKCSQPASCNLSNYLALGTRRKVRRLYPAVVVYDWAVILSTCAAHGVLYVNKNVLWWLNTNLAHHMRQPLGVMSQTIQKDEHEEPPDIALITMMKRVP